MLTIDSLREYGADVEDGVRRCAGMEAFYLKLVGSVLSNNGVDDLKAAIEAGDLDKAFEIAHALKGVYANLSLTPVCTPVSELTELLRKKADVDYGPLLEEAITQKNRLAALGE